MDMIISLIDFAKNNIGIIVCVILLSVLIIWTIKEQIELKRFIARNDIDMSKKVLDVKDCGYSFNDDDNNNKFSYCSNYVNMVNATDENSVGNLNWEII